MYTVDSRELWIYRSEAHQIYISCSLIVAAVNEFEKSFSFVSKNHKPCALFDLCIDCAVGIFSPHLFSNSGDILSSVRIAKN